jgi:hypothetical protein
MKPATNTLSEIFQAPIRLMVPLYQRPYVWEQERHWQPLWEDVEGVLDHHLDGGSGSVRHFLGAIVLDLEDTPLGELPRRLVIHGQQRSTGSRPTNTPRDGRQTTSNLHRHSHSTWTSKRGPVTITGPVVRWSRTTPQEAQAPTAVWMSRRSLPPSNCSRNAKS